MSDWSIYSDKNLSRSFGIQQTFDFEYSSESVSSGTSLLDGFLPEGGWPTCELSEVVCDHYETGLQLLLPLLASANAENRWITMISPPTNLDQSLFSYYGIDMSRVLLIHPKNDVDDKITMNNALKNGKSDIVIFWTKKLASRFLAQWRKSVKQGNCVGVIIHEKGKSHNSRSVALTIEAKAEENNILLKCAKKYGIQQKPKPEIVLPKVCEKNIADQQRRVSVQLKLIN